MKNAAAIDSHYEKITQANKEIELKSKLIQHRPYRLNYHFMAPTGWINDPNGLVQFQGYYHLFYQFNPYASIWGPSHWGHARSRDFVYWEHLPVALAPSEPYDSDGLETYGCASGSAVIDGDELVLIYTGHVEHRTPMQVQCLATSSDGLLFEKYPGNPVIGTSPEDGSKDFRDPRVWGQPGNWYMLVGTRKDNKGKAVLYISKDLKNWTYKSVTAESDGSQGDMWECPDLFSLGNTHILLISPLQASINLKPFYIQGDMDYESGKFTQKFSCTLDYGVDFYAPQTLIDDRGRRIIIAWMDNWLSKMPSREYGWAGAMTIPRELVVNGDYKLVQKPLAELEKLRSNPVNLNSIQVEGLKRIDELRDSVSEILIEFDTQATNAPIFGVQVRCSEDASQKTEIMLNMEAGEIILDREHSGCGEGGICKAPFQAKDNDLITLHIFLDTTSIEIFVNGGEQVITCRIFPDSSSNHFNLFSRDGTVHINSITAWQLRSIWTASSFKYDEKYY